MVKWKTIKTSSIMNLGNQMWFYCSEKW